METVKYPKRGDVLMGRPLFHQDKTQKPLAEKEHPCVVLKTVERTDLPGKPVMAIVLPLSHSETSAVKPNHLEVKAYHTRNLKMDKNRKSYICTDSPNVIILNGEENGVRKAAFAPEWVSPFTHGRIVDDKLLEAANALTKSFLAETQYSVPTQGRPEGMARPKAKDTIELPYEKRKAIVIRAAETEAARQSAGFLRLQKALRDVDIEGHSIEGADKVPGFRFEHAR